MSEAIMPASVIRDAIERLKANTVPPIKPNAHKVHATCCRGWRKASEHSGYCFTQREFYVMVAHPLRARGGA